MDIVGCLLDGRSKRANLQVTRVVDCCVLCVKSSDL